MGATSILDGIRIASPCRASWESMAGDDRVRSCSGCGKDVYNLSAMTISEASSLVAGREGKLCVRFYRRADGTVLTSDCPIGAGSARSGRLRKLGVLGLVGLALGSTGVAAFGFGRGPGDSQSQGLAGTLDDWVDWALIKIGWRTPPRATMGEPMFVPGLVPPVSSTSPPASSPGDSIPCLDPDSTVRP